MHFASELFKTKILSETFVLISAVLEVRLRKCEFIKEVTTERLFMHDCMSAVTLQFIAQYVLLAEVSL
jgi:hypothetical protein